ncbi:hypothetical protein CKAH01_12953 [Colletotrichum kahawae]|uniref:Uncharacterized protein n=1 Tax=Colletotrichum kahawae TaxID=34407 RepID=A0AAE0DC34_COLKA|nr:hypothetical protein CKAH01_12953 [Colletotrichum kahawae]
MLEASQQHKDIWSMERKPTETFAATPQPHVDASIPSSAGAEVEDGSQKTRVSHGISPISAPRTQIKLS